MAKKNQDPESFGTGQRKNAHPDGWSNARIEVDKHKDLKDVHGFRPGGPEGPHPVHKSK